MAETLLARATDARRAAIDAHASGTRLNRLFKDTVKDPEIEAELRPLLTRWKTEREPNERFGDFSARVFWPEQAAAAAIAAESAAQAPVAATVAPGATL